MFVIKHLENVTKMVHSRRQKVTRKYPGRAWSYKMSEEKRYVKKTVGLLP